MSGGTDLKKYLLIVICAFITSNSYAASKTLKITTGDWSPFCSEDNNNSIALNIITEAFATKGIKVEYIFLPWKRAYLTAINDSEYDASAIWRKTDERLKDFYFSDEVINVTTSFFYLKSKPFKWKSYNDLKGIKIGTTIGYSYGDYFDRLKTNKFLTIEETSTDKQNFLKLLHGRIRLFPVEKNVGEFILNKDFTPEQIKMFTIDSRPVNISSYYLIIPKRSGSEGIEIIRIFNSGLSGLKKSGRYKTLLNEKKQ